MKVQFINHDNFTLVLNGHETEKQGKEIFEFSNSEIQPFHVIIDNVAYYPDKHYLSDLSSIPKVLTIIKGMERYRWRRASLIHDQLYRNEYLYNRQGHRCYFTRPESDNIYRLLIIAEGAITNKTTLARIISPIQWIGLRIGGWLAWRNDAK
jgi:hypothetical protein